VPVTAPIKPVPNSSSTSLIKREKRRGDKGQPSFTPHKKKRCSGITGTGSFGIINQNILVSIVHLFNNIDKVSGHPDII
jgi:hypothetical protein